MRRWLCLMSLFLVTGCVSRSTLRREVDFATAKAKADSLEVLSTNEKFRMRWEQDFRKLWDDYVALKSENDSFQDENKSLKVQNHVYKEVIGLGAKKEPVKNGDKGTAAPCK